jgi:hypothetical protein
MGTPRDARTDASGRYYWRHGRRYESVTTMLAQGWPKPGLRYWSAAQVAEAAVGTQEIWAQMEPDEAIAWLKGAPSRATERAMVRGTEVHEWAERWPLGGRPRLDEFPPERRGWVKSFLDFVSQFAPRWEMAEASVFSDAYGYAGTADALMHVDVPELEGLGLVDYKTGTGRGRYPDVALQLAAYRHADFVGLDGRDVPMPEVSWCAVLHLRPDGYDLVPVQAGWREFERFLEVMANVAFGEREDLFGDPIIPLSRRPRPERPPNVAALVD